MSSAYCPLRSLRNASRASTGLHCGKRLFALPVLNGASRGFVPSGATSQTDQRPSANLSNAIVVPSCDQLGLTSSPGWLKTTCGGAPEPSAATTSSAGPLAIAIAVPSGDQTGPVTSESGGATPVASVCTSA